MSPFVTINKYSKKSFVVRGEKTKEHKDTLINLRGKWNRNLVGGPGWIFSKKNKQNVEDFVKQINSPNTTNQKLLKQSKRKCQNETPFTREIRQKIDPKISELSDELITTFSEKLSLIISSSMNNQQSTPKPPSPLFEFPSTPMTTPNTSPDITFSSNKSYIKPFELSPINEDEYDVDFTKTHFLDDKNLNQFPIKTYVLCVMTLILSVLVGILLYSHDSYSFQARNSMSKTYNQVLNAVKPHYNNSFEYLKNINICEKFKILFKILKKILL